MWSISCLSSILLYFYSSFQQSKRFAAIMRCILHTEVLFWGKTKLINLFQSAHNHLDRTFLSTLLPFVTSKFRVREAEIMDIPEIARLMKNLNGKETIATIENTICSRQNLAYVFTSGQHIVGLGVLEYGRPNSVYLI